MPNYGQDLNIGRPTKETYNVAEQNLEAVLSEIRTVAGNVEEATEELKKIRLGTGLVTGVDLNEEVE